MGADLQTTIPTLEGVLDTYATQLGGDFVGYRNHTYRVATLCAALASTGRDQIEKIAVAAAFHDVGIWSAATLDYLEPSAHLAGSYLTRTGHQVAAPHVGFEHGWPARSAIARLTGAPPKSRAMKQSGQEGYEGGFVQM